MKTPILTAISSLCVLIIVAPALGSPVHRRSVLNIPHKISPIKTSDAYFASAAKAMLNSFRLLGPAELQKSIATKGGVVAASARRRVTANVPNQQRRISMTGISKSVLLGVSHAPLASSVAQASGRRTATVRSSYGSSFDSRNSVQVQYIASSGTEEDATVLTRVFYFIYDSATGALRVYGNRLATPAEAGQAHLPTNPMQ